MAFKNMEKGQALILIAFAAIGCSHLLPWRSMDPWHFRISAMLKTQPIHPYWLPRGKDPGK